MKKKTLGRKLALNKKIIANIGNSEMNDARGGVTGWCSDQYSNCDGVSLCGTEPPPSDYCTGWCSDQNSNCVGVSFCGI